ncbi:MAG: cellulose binding domain-containing protein [Clostridia bacterium]|nr:cellulose binding domain-containing protein [Clostridia bacterium]
MKYKIRKKKKLKLIPLFCVLVIAFGFMTIGYSVLTDEQRIVGTANIKPQEPEEVIEGLSTYEFRVISQWENGGQEGIINYTVNMFITNNDGDFDEWIVNFDILNGTPLEITAWTSSITTITDNNVDFHCQTWNASVPNGTVLELGFNMALETTDSTVDIANLTFNGKRIAGEIVYQLQN